MNHTASKKLRWTVPLVVVAVMLLTQASFGAPLATYNLTFGGAYAAASNIASTNTASYWGAGAWRETYPSAKTEIYIDPATQLGGAFTIDDIESITYHTLNQANNPSDVDFYLALYTSGATSCTGSWYCHRLNAEPYLSNGYVAPTAGVWNTWTTDALTNQLTFFDQGNCGAFGFYGEPTLQQIQGGPITWSAYAACPGGTNTPIDYGPDTVTYITFQTGSGWSAFDGYIDAIIIELKNGDIHRIDLEDFVDEVWVDDDWAGSFPGQEVAAGKFFGHNAFATIQDGVDNVSGSTVHVGPGAYTGNVVISTVGLQLLADPGAVLTGGVHITANGVTIDGLTILNGGSFAGTTAGILIDGGTSGHLLSDNVLTGAGTSINARGIEFGFYTSAIEVTGNEIEAWLSGIYINPTNAGSNLDINNNYIHDNFAGIGSDGLNDVAVTNNIFANNTEGWGASTVGAGVQGYHNIFSNNTTGIAHYGGSAIAATCNWWDDISGPTSIENSGGLGDSFSSPAAGLVTFSPWLVYNNDASAAVGFQIPTSFAVAAGADASAADNGYRRLENAIGCVLNGQTVTLSGTFDWTAANAAARWALGNDGVANTADDYSILVPTNVNGVTLTAASLGNATIQGPGDLAAANLEGVLVFDGGDNKNWTISNLRFVDFDLGIGMFNGAGGVDAFNGTAITNNYFLVASDLNAAAAPADVNQNIGIHYAFGVNQTIANNTIEFPGNGVSDAGAPADWWTYGVAGGSLFSSNVGMQSNTSGGAVYDGLLIDNNTLTVLGAQSSNPARIFGIWENGHAHSSDITVSNNDFTNPAAGNDPTLNRQMAFRVTSHSSASTTVAYMDNTAQGASIGFSGIDVSAGVSPVEMTGNTVSNANTGFLLKGLHNWHLSDTTLSNTGAMAGVGTGVQAPATATVTIDAATASNTISGFAVGVDSAGSTTIEDNTTSVTSNSTGILVTAGTATITNNSITGNTIGIDVQGGSATMLYNTIGTNGTGTLVQGTGTAVLTCNNITGNTTYGVNNTTTALVDAEANWWGTAGGPTHSGNPGGTGDVVSDNVDFVPWAGASAPGGCGTLIGPSLAIEKAIVTPASRNVFYAGEEVAFRVAITNTGPLAIEVLPLTDLFDTACLQFSSKGATPQETSFDNTAGTVQWNDLTLNNPPLDLDPGESVVVTMYFDVVSGSGASTNTARITDALDPYGNSAPVVMDTINFTCVAADFGDLPDTTAATGAGDYQTLLANDGPRHTITALTLGAAIDSEADGQPTANADGDDVNPAAGPDDEDGVTFPSLIAGQTATVLVDASGAGRLNAFFDWNNDGDFGDAGEAIAELGVVAGSNNLSVPVPLDAVTGANVGVRFRLSTAGGLGPTGAAADGEVEDYLVTVSALDFGDLPDTTAATGAGDYQTLLANDGPRHTITTLTLGAAIDREADGQPTANADGDDLAGATPDDEDGVTFPALIAGQTATVLVDASGVGRLNAFFDWNNDGDFGDAGEAIAEIAVGAGSNNLSVPVPLDAVTGANVGVRFRLSTAGGLGPTGAAADGEVEDYLATVSALDFGDAPDGPYPTLLVNNGARHTITPNLYLGAAIDNEADGQPNASATGDDLNANPPTGPDDEDGVMIGPLAPGVPGTVTVTAFISSGFSGLLDAWIDFGDDGVWGASDQIFASQVLVNGVNTLTFNVPAGAVVTPQTFARFRLSSAGGLATTGPAPDGEVEDYAAEITAGDDFGDAPDGSYPTLLANNGARHTIVAGLYLGAAIDNEADGQPDANATGDDLNANPPTGPDDEDGVIFSPLVPGGQGTVTVVASAAGFLDAWIDFGDDGSWAQTGDQIFVSQALSSGSNTLMFAVPAGAVVTPQTFARFRFSSAGGLSYTGLAPDGEVEDYAVEILPLSTLSGFVWIDLGSDGIINPPEDQLGIYNAPIVLTWAGPDDDLDTVGDNVTYNTATGLDGTYSFAGLQPGVYRVDPDQTSPALTGLYLVSPAGGEPVTVTVLPGQDLPNVNFGYLPTTGVAVFGFEASSSPTAANLRWQALLIGEAAPVYRVLRSPAANPADRVDLGEARAASSTGQIASYAFQDRMVQAGERYLYWLQDPTGVAVGPWAVRVTSGRIFLPFVVTR